MPDYLTQSVEPIPGVFKERPEDFWVEEIPAYEPCGTGEHVYLQFEKTRLTTRQAVDQVARLLKVPPMDCGIAGLKDAQAVTVQTMSIKGVESAAVESLEIPGLKILSVSRHTNKLRLGHLRANRFKIKLREMPPARFEDVRAVLEALKSEGVPNFFGPQRFGMRKDTGKVGKAMVLRDFDQAVRFIAGMPEETDPEIIRQARTLFEAGRFMESSRLWTGGFRQCAQLCRAMERTGGNAEKSLFSLETSWLWFFITAFQSELFNHVLTRRLNTLSRIWPGDLACKHVNGAVFLVEDAAAEQLRADAFEISPSGPLYGFKMIAPKGQQAVIETEVLEASGVKSEDFFRPGILKCQGARRPLRFPLEDCGALQGEDAAGDYLEISFKLPPGAYATAVLREIFKSGEW
jgi:tRNA pseudouridine13 synthase